MQRKPAVLAIHGLGGGPYELTTVVDALRAEGLNVATPTLPGHEGGGPTMPASRWEDWVKTVEDAFDRLAKETKGPVAVVGFSTGGTLALGLSRVRKVERLALLAPFLAIRHTTWLPFKSASAVRMMVKVMPDLPRREPPVRDPEMRKWVASQERYRTFSLGATLSALELIERTRPEVPRVEVPALVIQGRKDSVVEPSEAQWLIDRLGSREKRLAWMDRSDHLVALDYDREHVAKDVVRFMVQG